MRSFSPFERRLRRAARWALYGSLLSIGALAVAVLLLSRRLWPERGPDEAWRSIRFAELEEVRLLQDYLRIDTTRATGSVRQGAEFLGRELRAMGLDPVIERLGERYTNVWAFLEGEDSRALVLHNHIDVSPPGDASAWKHPPFSGAIDLPFIYGRGAFDMKSLTIAQLLALRDLAQAGGRPRRSVLFLATGSEEQDSELGAQWILRQHPELVGRFWAVLTEGGVVEPVAVDDVKYWGIEFAQKQFAYGWACAPTRERLETLQREVGEWGRKQRQPRLHPTVESYLAAYSGSRDHPHQRHLLARIGHESFDPFLFGTLPRYLRSLFLDEVVFFPVEEVAGEGFRLPLIFHLLPGSDLDAVRARLLPDWLTHDLTVALGGPVGAATSSPLDHEVYRTLAELLRRAHPTSTVGPQFLSWSATDSRFFRELGIPSYGFSPFLFFNTEALRADRANERINLPGYIDGVALYRQVVARLAG
ncbi:MAG: M20/M25/M40 family metallo-hydrolase [Thermoanaerobaculia bacterium]